MALLQKQLQRTSVQFASSKPGQPRGSRVAVRAASRQADSLQLAVSAVAPVLAYCSNERRGTPKLTTCPTSPAALQAFPSEYDTAIRQAQLATKAALADGHKLLEVRWCTWVLGARLAHPDLLISSSNTTVLLAYGTQEHSWNTHHCSRAFDARRQACHCLPNRTSNSCSCHPPCLAG
jgi:hypothetical protein